MSRDPDVSAVICTRDRPAAVARCLDALAAQEAPVLLEAIVVDDGSAVPGDLAFVSRYPFARLIRTPHAGVAAARNAGARTARGRVVAFTDDDCVPASDWVARLREAFEQGGADAVVGRTTCDHDPFGAATQAIVNELAERAAREPPLTEFGPGNNMACRQEVFSAVPFDEVRYFRSAGEDRDWCARLVAAGYRLVAEPGAVVEHRHELDLRRFWNKHRHYGRGAFLVHTGTRRPRREHPGFYAALLRNGFRRGLRTGLLVALSQVATLVGFAEQAATTRTRRRRYEAAGSQGAGRGDTRSRAKPAK